MSTLQEILGRKVANYLPKEREPELLCMERTLAKIDIGTVQPLALVYKGECIESSTFSRKATYTQCKYKDKTAWLYRVVYEIFRGPVASDLMVRHLCHNKYCINPIHLELGTAKDNYQDQIDANRPVGSAAPGERHHNASLTAAQVREIFLYKGRKTQVELGKDYGVDNSTISRIKRQVDWVIVTQDLPGSKFLKG